MSEKRFTVESTMVGECILDNKTGEQLDTFDYTERLCDLLNEQQFIINKLQDFFEQSDYENAKLRLENKKLKAENEQLHKMYHNLGQAIVKTCNDLNKTEEVYLADFNICKRITEYEKELFDDE